MLLVADVCIHALRGWSPVKG